MQFDFVKASDDELRVMIEVAYIMRDCGKFDEARSILNGVSNFIPQTDVPKVGLATIELQRGNYQLAEIICSDAMKLNPDSLYARVHHAEALLFQKKRDEAESELNAIIASGGDSPHSRTAKALLGVADMLAPR